MFRLQYFLILLFLPVLVKAEHWAFTPPKNSVPPRVRDSSWIRNEIDQFILAKLEAGRILPSKEASRYTLIRRLSLDLTGLPPSSKLVLDFIRDDSIKAYSRLVERLLASPHFGERQAQDWFDLARFADTSGYAADRTRNVWPYRDWVIGAFNSNMPFNRFSIDQLAGDMMPNANQDQRVASAFHRHAMQAKGNNPRKEEFRIKGIVDRLESTGRTWLGLTLECAECHDHKHDPISQKDYYKLFAIFNNVPHLGSGYGVHGPMMMFNYSDSQFEKQQLIERLDMMRKEITLDHVSHEGLVGEWQKSQQIKDPNLFNLDGDLTITAEIQTVSAVSDIVSKYDWRGGQRSYVFGIGGEGDEKASPGKLFAWFSSDAATFQGAVAYGSQRVNDGRPHHVAMVFEAGRSVRFFVDGIEDENVRVEGAIPKTLAKSTRGLAIGAGFENSSEAKSFRFEGKLKNVQLYERTIDNPAGIDLSSPLMTEYKQLFRQLSKLATPAIEVPVMDELPEPRVTHLLIRGDYKNKGEKVIAGTPEILPVIHSSKGRDPNRLDFARWLFSDNQPLTARVVVNRIWRYHFGEGLVRTVADFGRYGDRPSHPKLLDWLAIRFVDSGWDIKAMHRLIVNSSTYRQVSIHRKDLSKVDPLNRLLARFPRVRLPAEQIRDRILASSGQLSQRIGGPSVFPVQPAGLYEERGQNLPGNSNFKWKNSIGEDQFRRSIYTYWKRMMLHPVMSSFDAPTRQVCVTKRSVTNTPQQALIGMNEPAMHAAAIDLAKRLSKYEGDSEKVIAAYLICFSRMPDSQELQHCHEFISRHREKTAMDVGDEWSVFAAVLLNLDEGLYRE